MGISCRQLRFRRWLSYDPTGCCEIATAPAEPRNDKSDSLLHPEGRKGKPESAFLPCHCEEGEARRGNLKQALSNSPGLSCVPACTARLPRLLRSLAMTSQGGFPHPEGRNDKPESRCGRRAASANPYAISGNCYISHSADRSTHLGFIVAISASFLLRDQLFICFSRSIAALTSGVVSK